MIRVWIIRWHAISMFKVLISNIYTLFKSSCDLLWKSKIINIILQLLDIQIDLILVEHEFSEIISTFKDLCLTHVKRVHLLFKIKGQIFSALDDIEYLGFLVLIDILPKLH